MLGPAGDPPVRPICRTESTIYVIEDVVFAERTAEAPTDITGVTEEGLKEGRLVHSPASPQVNTCAREVCAAHIVLFRP